MVAVYRRRESLVGGVLSRCLEEVVIQHIVLSDDEQLLNQVYDCFTLANFVCKPQVFVLCVHLPAGHGALVQQ